MRAENTAYQKAWDVKFPPVSAEKLNPAAKINAGNKITELNRNVWNVQDVVPHAWQYNHTDEKQSSSTPAEKQFYFSKGTFGLATQVGTLIPGTLFKTTAWQILVG